MAKFCHGMHYILPISVIYVAHSALRPLFLHHKFDRFHAFSFDTDDVIMIIKTMVMMLKIILLSNKRGCSIAVGS